MGKKLYTRRHNWLHRILHSFSPVSLPSVPARDPVSGGDAGGGVASRYPLLLISFSLTLWRLSPHPSSVPLVTGVQSSERRREDRAILHRTPGGY